MPRASPGLPRALKTDSILIHFPHEGPAWALCSASCPNSPPAPLIDTGCLTPLGRVPALKLCSPLSSAVQVTAHRPRQHGMARFMCSWAAWLGCLVPTSHLPLYTGAVCAVHPGNCSLPFATPLPSLLGPSQILPRKDCLETKKKMWTLGSSVGKLRQFRNKKHSPTPRAQRKKKCPSLPATSTCPPPGPPNHSGELAAPTSPPADGE